MNLFLVKNSNQSEPVSVDFIHLQLAIKSHEQIRALTFIMVQQSRDALKDDQLTKETERCSVESSFFDHHLKALRLEYYP
jgi:uncharacterized membrane protein